MSILEIKNISKSFGANHVLKNVNFYLNQGTISTLIGTNGAGKTCLFNIVTGFLNEDGGEVLLEGVNILGFAPHKINRLGLGRTFQDVRLAPNLTVLENVMLAFKDQPGENWWNALFHPKRNSANQKNLQQRASSILQSTFLSEIANQLSSEISFGQQKLLTIACLLANDPKILLLDEPVAGINPNFRDKMITLFQALKTQGKTILFIEHHADFIEAVSDKVFFLNEGEIKSFDSYSQMRTNDNVRNAYV